MCGRYAFYDHQELSERLTNIALDTAFLDQFRPTWNASPSQTLPVIRGDAAQAAVEGMHWGLIPRWTKPGERPKVTPINARAETLAEKPMFRSLIRNRRVVVPANGFYEWKRMGDGKQPYFIHPKSSQLMLLAGLYDEAPGEDGPRASFTIITTSASDTMAPLHDRMPVILEPDDVEEWLDPDLDAFEPLEHLLRPAPDDALEMYPVSRDVNNPRHNGPDLIEEIDEPDEG
jgi:putative SOS response-associated peptidase YedK